MWTPTPVTLSPSEPGTFNGRDAFAVNYDDVGFFPSDISRLNSFQVILVDRSDVGAGDFDFLFNYDQIEWETGGASGGTGGLGGSSARAGFSNGSGNPGTFFELAGSAVNGAFLDGGPNSLADLGSISFEVRNGGVTVGSSPFTLTNSSPDPAAEITQLTLDVSSLNLEFDASGSDGSSSFPFTAFNGTDTATGLSGVTAADGGSILTLDFTDFAVGESLSFQIDVDSDGLDDIISGDDLIGANGIVTFSNGLTATATLVAGPTANSATVLLSAVPDAGLVTILNDDIDLELQPANVAVQNEGSDDATTVYEFEVTRAGFITDSTEDTTVDFQVTGLGNLDADDFISGVIPSGTVTFPASGPGSLSQTIRIEVLGDDIAELDETFTVTLSNAVNNDLNLDTLQINNDTESATILNDDTSNVIVVDSNPAEPGDVFVQEPDTGEPNNVAVFTIQLDNPADEDITIDVTTRDGTATTANNDYVANSDTVIILAGDTTGTFSVEVVGDNAVELDENFFIDLADPTYAGINNDATTGGPAGVNSTVFQVQIDDAEGEGVINNEDALIEFSDLSSLQNEAGVVVASESGPTLIVRGDLTGTSDIARTVTLQRLGGTADPSNDFTFGSDPGQLLPAVFIVPEGNYSAGNPLGSFDLTLLDENGDLASVSGNDPVLNIIDDSLIEGNESLTVELQGLGTALQQGNANQGLNAPNNASNRTDDDTTHIIGDDDFAIVTILPGQTVEEELGTQPVTVQLTTTGTTGAPAVFAPGVSISPGRCRQAGGGTAGRRN